MIKLKNYLHSPELQWNIFPPLTSLISSHLALTFLTNVFYLHVITFNWKIITSNFFFFLLLLRFSFFANDLHRASEEFVIQLNGMVLKFMK